MKKTYTLNLDLEAIEILKARKEFNLSQFVASLCKIEANLPCEKSDIISDLKLTNTRLLTEIGNASVSIGERDREINKLKQILTEKREKIRKLNQKIEEKPQKSKENLIFRRPEEY